MGRMMWHQTTPQRLEPVGPDRDYGAGVGPDQPRHQLTRLTLTKMSPATVLICLSTQPLTFSESLWNLVISGAEVLILDQCLTDTVLNVTLRALFAVAHIIIPHRSGPYRRDDRVVREEPVTQWRC